MYPKTIKQIKKCIIDREVFRDEGVLTESLMHSRRSGKTGNLYVVYVALLKGYDYRPMYIYDYVAESWFGRDSKFIPPRRGMFGKKYYPNRVQGYIDATKPDEKIVWVDKDTMRNIIDHCGFAEYCKKRIMQELVD